MPLQAYQDLERYDDEAFTSVSLLTLARVGQALAIAPSEMLLGETSKGLRQTVAFDMVAKRLVEVMETDRITVDEYGQRIGWDVRDIVSNPNGLWNCNVDALYHICAAIGIDWVAVLPDRTGERT